MQKNVAKRLQNLEKEIKSVLSICDIANNHGKQRCSSSADKSIAVDPRMLFKNGPALHSNQTSPERVFQVAASNLFKQDTSPRSADKVKFREENDSDYLDLKKKPGSAPSSSGSSPMSKSWCERCHKRIQNCSCKKRSRSREAAQEGRQNSDEEKSRDTTAFKVPDKLKAVQKESSKPSVSEDLTQNKQKRAPAPAKIRSNTPERGLDSSPRRKISKGRPQHKTRQKSADRVKSEKNSVVEKVLKNDVNEKAELLRSSSIETMNSVYAVAMQAQSVTCEKEKRKQAEAATRKLKEIIEKNHERVQEMKRSKELALEIAKELKEKYDTVQTSKKELCDQIRKLQEVNDKLQKDLKDMSETKLKLHSKIDGLRKEFKSQAEQHEAKNKDLMEENHRLKERMKEMERHFKEEVAEKELHIGHLHKTRFPLESAEVDRFVQQKAADYVKLVERQEAANRVLLTRINILEKQIKASKDKEKRHSEVKIEIKRRSEELNKLRNEFTEQRRIAQERLLQLERLEEEKTKQADEIKTQRDELKNKRERLEQTNQELESIRSNSNELENQVQTLRQAIDNFDKTQKSLVQRTNDYEQQITKDQQLLEAIQQEKKKLLDELENGKDSLLIKNKIIEDQQETIKQLRDKYDEMRSILRRNQSLERIIDVEREEKLELQETVEVLKWRKDELKQKVKSLEEDLLLAPQEVVRDLQKTQIVLQELESQVHIKQKEWELHLQTLLREKEQACNAAEFATKKLMQTTSEFQRQSEEQKRLHRALAENLAEKERHLKEANEKVSNTQLDYLITELLSETKRTSKAMDRHRCAPQIDVEELYPRVSSSFCPKRTYSPRHRGAPFIQERDFGSQETSRSYLEDE